MLRHMTFGSFVLNSSSSSLSTVSCNTQRVKMKTMAILAILTSTNFPATHGPSEQTCPFLVPMLPLPLERTAAGCSSFRGPPMVPREPAIFPTMIPKPIAGPRWVMCQLVLILRSVTLRTYRTVIGCSAKRAGRKDRTRTGAGSNRIR